MNVPVITDCSFRMFIPRLFSGLGWVGVLQVSASAAETLPDEAEGSSTFWSGGRVARGGAAGGGAPFRRVRPGFARNLLQSLFALDLLQSARVGLN